MRLPNRMHPAALYAIAAIMAFGLTAAAGYQTLIYTEQGGAKQVVASGGEVEVQSGGVLDTQAGATVNLLGRTMAVVQYNSDPNSTTTTVAITGLDATDLVFASMSKANSAYLKSAAAGSGVATLTWSADPGTTVTVDLLALMD